LLLCNDEIGKSGLHHILMPHMSHTYFNYCLSWAMVTICRFSWN